MNGNSMEYYSGPIYRINSKFRNIKVINQKLTYLWHASDFGKVKFRELFKETMYIDNYSYADT
jgi:hypothetical protein